MGQVAREGRGVVVEACERRDEGERRSIGILLELLKNALDLGL